MDEMEVSATFACFSNNEIEVLDPFSLLSKDVMEALVNFP